MSKNLQDTVFNNESPSEDEEDSWFQDENPLDQILAPDKETGTGGLWLGNLAAAENVSDLKEKNIGYVLSVIDGISMENLYKRYEQNGILYKHIVIHDSMAANQYEHFEEAVEFIQNGLKTSNVYVHCFMGVSRSASMVIAYQISTRKKKYGEILNFVKGKRPIVGPNYNFVKMLRKWDAKINN